VRPLLLLAGAVFAASACSLFVKFDPEGQSCAPGGECLSGYVCVDGKCRPGSDAGYAFFEAVLSSNQVESWSEDPSSGFGRFEYDYGANTLRWSVDHDAGQAVSAALFVGHPGWTASSAWKGLGSAQAPITGSMVVTDTNALVQELTRGHVYIGLFDQYGWEIIRGYIVEPGGRIYVATLWDAAWVRAARAGFVVSADASTLYYDVTMDGADGGFDSSHIHDSTRSILVDTPWVTNPEDPTRISGAIALPERVLPLLDTNNTYYEVHSAAAVQPISGPAQGTITKVK
jgi:hypothetical protein